MIPFIWSTKIEQLIYGGTNYRCGCLVVRVGDIAWQNEETFWDDDDSLYFLGVWYVQVHTFFN